MSIHETALALVRNRLRLHTALANEKSLLPGSWHQPTEAKNAEACGYLEQLLERVGAYRESWKRWQFDPRESMAKHVAEGAVLRFIIEQTDVTSEANG